MNCSARSSSNRWASARSPAARGRSLPTPICAMAAFLGPVLAMGWARPARPQRGGRSAQLAEELEDTQPLVRIGCSRP